MLSIIFEVHVLRPEAAMGIGKDLKSKAKQTRKEGVFTLKLDEGISLANVVRLRSGYVPGRQP